MAKPKPLTAAPTPDAPPRYRTLRTTHMIQPPWLTAPRQTFSEGQDLVDAIELTPCGVRVTWVSGESMTVTAAGVVYEQ